MEEAPSHMKLNTSQHAVKVLKYFIFVITPHPTHIISPVKKGVYIVSYVVSKWANQSIQWFDLCLSLLVTRVMTTSVPLRTAMLQITAANGI